MSITITKGGIPLAIKTWLFPDSTLGVRLDTENHAYRFADASYAVITAKIQSSNDLIELLMATDALNRFDPDTPIHLFLPAFPCAQQDRVCSPGEALSVKVIADLINAQGYECVTIVDPHSDVTPALIERVHVITSLEVIGRFDALNAFILDERAVLVSPDAGSAKKVSEVAKHYGHASYIRCDKRRELATGKIVETLVYADDDQVRGKTCVILDDVAVGGATFISVAIALKARGAAKVALHVSHGVFSKGTAPLYAGGIDRIFTTNSVWGVQPAGVEATVLVLEEVFSL